MGRLWTALAWVLAVIVVLPIVWMISTAVKPPIEYVSDSINLLPRAPTLAHFHELITEDEILGKLMNSIIVTITNRGKELADPLPASSRKNLHAKVCKR